MFDGLSLITTRYRILYFRDCRISFLYSKKERYLWHERETRNKFITRFTRLYLLVQVGISNSDKDLSLSMNEIYIYGYTLPTTFSCFCNTVT